MTTTTWDISSHNLSQQTWRAKNTKFLQKTEEERIKMMGVSVLRYEEINEKEHKAMGILEYLGPNPNSFDTRLVWPASGIPVRDQGNCGSCWAHSATEVLSARAKILGYNFNLSAEPLIKWCLSGHTTPNKYMNSKNTCDGSDLQTPWKFLTSIGSVPIGPKFNCSAKQKWFHSNSRRNYEISNGNLAYNIRTIQQELMSHGPIQVAFDVYLDFVTYEEGIYQKSNAPGNTYLGGHAVMLLGWGYLNGMYYWICQNSWGKDWGQNGFFKIAFTRVLGEDSVIEMNAFASTFNPIPTKSNTKTKKKNKRRVIKRRRNNNLKRVKLIKNEKTKIGSLRMTRANNRPKK